MTYEEYRNNRQREMNELPIFFALTNKQLEEELNKRGLTLDDTDKIYRLGDSGGFYLKTDAPIIRAYFTKHDELEDLMKNHEFAVSAFEYEMDNHEYAINMQGDWDVCSCFCKCAYDYGKDYENYLNEGGMSHCILAYKEAKRKHYKKAEVWF